MLRDPGETGLTIRVSGRSAGWFLKWNGKFKRLGGVGSPDVRAERRESGYIYTGKDAVELGGRVREMMKLGLDVDAYLAARALGVGHEQANATGASIAARDSGAWTFAILAERYIAESISKPTITRTGAVKPESQKTIKEVQALFRHPDVADALNRKLARDVQKQDVEAIRDLWWDAGAKGRQQKLIVYVKSAYKWAKRRHSAAQLDDVAPWWSELQFNAYASKAEIAKMEGKLATPPLTARDVAMVLHIAERNRVAPDRKIRLETTEIALAALWWVALTAQRTHAAYQATIDRIVDRTRHEGWYEVSWIPVDMKSGRHFTLAIPPIVFERTLGRALLDPHRRRDSVWVFPSSRTKLRGKDGL
ncbi:hypothetical protein VQ042_23095 [Aurantimonas sp. A2-1-M11]|uniref:hypothetical protein n=1 Tax=Aurantimonas sp. A2-1-M11 TaxID=3113712 RepID=UPI002F94FDE1